MQILKELRQSQDPLRKFQKNLLEILRYCSEQTHLRKLRSVQRYVHDAVCRCQLDPHSAVDLYMASNFHIKVSLQTHFIAGGLSFRTRNTFALKFSQSFRPAVLSVQLQVYQEPRSPHKFSVSYAPLICRSEASFSVCHPFCPYSVPVYQS